MSRDTILVVLMFTTKIEFTFKPNPIYIYIYIYILLFIYIYSNGMQGLYEWRDDVARSKDESTRYSQTKILLKFGKLIALFSFQCAL